MSASPKNDPVVTSLLVIADHYQRPLSAEALVAGLPLVKESLPPGILPRLAKRAGFSAAIREVPLDYIPRSALPAILLMKSGVFVVLFKIEGENNAEVVRIDAEHPKGEKSIIHFSDLKTEYSGETCFLKPEFAFKHLEIDTQALEGKKHWFWSVVKQMRPIYNEVLVASFLINLFAIALPLFTMNVYDRVVPNHAIETLWVLASGIFIIFLFDFLMRSLRGYFINVASKHVDNQLSATIFEQLLSIRLIARPPSLGAFTNILRAFEGFREFITTASVTVIIDLPFVLLFLLVIWGISGNIVLIPLITIPLVIVVGFFIQKPLREWVNQLHQLNAEKQSTLLESLVNTETIKSIGAETPLQSRWEQVICVTAALNTKLHAITQVNTNFSIFIQQITSALVIIAGVYQIQAGNLTVGGLIACTILTGRVMAPITQVAGLISRYYEAMQGLDAVEELMKMPVDKPVTQAPLSRPHIQGKVQFDRVNFYYPQRLVPALSEISFTIQPGEHVGIIGRIGSGKSTIAKLLMGLYPPNSGNIFIDNTALQQFDLHELRRQLGYVSQDINLFHGSIRENITYHMPTIDETSILKAAEISGVSEFVNQLSEGFDFNIGERGSRLSEGQRQTIAIARAILLDPPILIFDEPTHSMDDRTEGYVKTHLQDYAKNKTLILITHKGSMLHLVQRLILVDRGKMIVDGPKDTILQQLRERKIQV